MSESGNDFRFDILRAVAIIFVIAIHSSEQLFNYCSSIEASFFEKVAYSLLEIRFIAVPLFVMISGALLLGKEEPISVFFRKRISRLLIPFVVWSLIVHTISFIQDGGGDVFECLQSLLYKSLVDAGAHPIYWYIYMIIPIYLFTPVWRILLKHSNKSEVYYLFLTLVVLTILCLLFPDAFFCKNISSTLFECTMYYIGGYVLYRYAIHESWFPFLTKLLFIAGVFILSARFLVTNTFSNQLYVARIIFSFGFFGGMLLVTRNRSKGHMRKVVGSLSSYSYGMYLTHFMFISVLVHVPLISGLYPFFEFAFVVLLTIFLDCLMFWILEKMGLKRLVM